MSIISTIKTTSKTILVSSNPKNPNSDEMNEAETRAELIDPKLKACGWGVVKSSRILREYNITAGKIQTGGVRAKKLTADYVLVYKGIKLAVVEAKSDDLEEFKKSVLQKAFSGELVTKNETV
jgi:type I restriction enzyme, R subunit